MYTQHWKLRSKPFESGPTADFYYPSETHQGGMLKLRYAIENRRGAALLSGPAGVGKTLLVRSLFQALPETISPRTHIVFPSLPGEQLLAYIANELTGRRFDTAARSAHQSVAVIQSALTETLDAGKHAVLAIDEGQLVSQPDTLELLRLLLNFESEQGQALTLLFVGQGTMMPAIERVPSLEERLAVKCILRAFTMDETASYITHRLQTAGAEEEIFTSTATDAIHQITGGIARQINRICELALLVGYAEQRTVIEAEQIEGVTEELLTVSPE